MIGVLNETQVSQAFIEACDLELQALKPGNVHIHSGGHEMTVSDFEKSSRAAAPHLVRIGQTVGQRIVNAINATRSVVDFNTNLGIVLLCAPIAHAALMRKSGSLGDRLKETLSTLTIQDARDAYQAITIAQPGGLGEVSEHDVSAEPHITLLEAMRQSEQRDRIAWQYTHDYADIFKLGLSRVREGLERGFALPWAATYCYIGFLASIPDTLISRKRGVEKSAEIQAKAQHIEDQMKASSNIRNLTVQLIAFDTELKSRSLNPGTTADLTVATIFVHLLLRRSTEACL